MSNGSKLLRIVFNGVILLYQCNFVLIRVVFVCPIY